MPQNKLHETLYGKVPFDMNHTVGSLPHLKSIEKPPFYLLKTPVTLVAFNSPGGHVKNGQV